MKRREFIKGSAILGAFAVAPSLALRASGIFSSAGYRRAVAVLEAHSTLVGTLPIMRAFAGDYTDFVSPFVMFDEFGPVTLNPGDQPLRVDAHPHAGVIPTTYFLSGSGHHKDSLNFDFQVGKGEFMMFSSGRGAIHMEETGQKLYDDGGDYHGFQIWLNIPKKYKFIEPTTAVKNEEDMPLLTDKKYSIKVVLGELLGQKSKIELLSPAFYYHIRLEKDGRIDIPTNPNHNAFIYVIQGEVEITDNLLLKKNQLALMERDREDIPLFAKEGAEMLVMGGQPLNEPVYAYGPFVMNSEEEIRKCYKDYRSGKMGDPMKVN